MAANKEEAKEGKQNKAEAAVTPGVEPAPRDVSLKPEDKATPEEKTEGKANENEAVKAKEKRVKEETVAQPKAYPPSHNGQNRRISAMLRASRQERDMTSLRDENRKLKAQVRRLASESDTSHHQPEQPRL